MKIRKICVSGKALREEVVPERVSGELAGTSNVSVDSCNSEFESIKCCSSISTSAIKRSSERFVDLFGEKIKFSRDKYAVLRVRWYGYARVALKSWEARKKVHDSCKDADILYDRWFRVYSIWNVVSGTVCSRSIVEVRRNGKTKMLESMLGTSLRSRSQQSMLRRTRKKKKVCLVINNENN